MKKLVTRIGAATLVICMVMSMAVSVSAVTKYYLQLSISGKNVQGDDVTVVADGPYIGKEDSLAVAVNSIVLANANAQQKAIHQAHPDNIACPTDACALYQMWSAELDRVFDAGKLQYGQGNDAWQTWVDLYDMNRSNQEMVSWLKDLDTTVGGSMINRVGEAFELIYAAPTMGDYVVTIKLLSKTLSDPIVGPSDDDEDGKDKVTTETVTKPDGTTVTTTTNNETGEKTEKVETTDGVTVTTNTDKNGNESVPEVTVPDNVGTDPVTLPETGKTQFSVTVGDQNEEVKIEIPVENITHGTVAVIVHSDGTEEVVKDTVMTEDSIIVTLEEDATVKVIDNSKQFIDIDGHWAENAVTYVAARHLFAGTGTGTTFSPEDRLTRAMMAQVIYNLEGAESHNYDHGFTDIAAGQWYTEAVNWAAREGVVAGYGDKSYQPDKLLSREEVVQIFYNYAKAKGFDISHRADLSDFVDHAHISDWARVAKKWGIGSGLIAGKGGGVIDPKANTTRAEAAQMFMNFLQYIAD